MQTFLPYPDIIDSALVLDNRRLFKQCIETLQILDTLAGNSKGWRNHPAVGMWEGHRYFLARYGMAMCDAARLRYFDIDSVAGKIFEHQLNVLNVSGKPGWFGDDRVHASHRSNLLRKDAKWYGKFNWKEPNNLPYFWPV